MGESPRSSCLGVTPFRLPWLRCKLRLYALRVETEETVERQYRLKKDCVRYEVRVEMEETTEHRYRLRDTVRCEVRVEIEEAAGQEYSLRDAVFAVRNALRPKKRRCVSIG